MKRTTITLIVFVCLLPFWVSLALPEGAAVAATGAYAVAPPPPPNNQSGDRLVQVEAAVQVALARYAQVDPRFQIEPALVKNVEVSADGNWAIAWMVRLDLDTGDPLPSEPGLAVALRTDAGWEVTLPMDPAWEERVQALPDSLLNPQAKTNLLIEKQTAQAAAQPSAPLRGYLLPWEAGRKVFLTQSVGHDKYTSSGSAHYAFDFSIYMTMWPVLAAKAGTVSSFHDTCPTVPGNEQGDPNCPNWIVLKDTTTTPTSYQLYLHLAQNSIPLALKEVGAYVEQGQFVGIDDNTGASFGHHLHFMVYTTPASSWWGNSVDITFNDVFINGGRPRVYKYDTGWCKDTDVCEQFADSYISANFPKYGDHTPPSGDLTEPIQAARVATRTLDLAGWAADDNSGLASVTIMANYDGLWRPVSQVFTTTLLVTRTQFTASWDLCAAGVPDGPVSLALEVWDRAHNLAPDLPGLVHVLKDYTCPPPLPVCKPGDRQVALFAEPDYRGACQVFNGGVYSTAASLGALGDNAAASILVGSQVRATLYTEAGLKGRGETFPASPESGGMAPGDSNLSDNPVGAGSVSSLSVQLRTVLPSPARFVWPPNNTTFSPETSLSLSWANGGGDQLYQARLEGFTTTLTSTWSSALAWNLGSLPSGTYTWQLRAANEAGQSSWSGGQTFFLQGPEAIAPLAATLPAPFTDTMEITPTQWSASSNWDLTTDDNHTPGGKISWAYDTNSKPGEGYRTYELGVDTPNMGDLTSPSISLPVSGTYSLHFWYKYETEGPGETWDQRWVQLSVDGGPFSNLYQLTSDTPNYWLRSPAFSFNNYRGHSVRVRFHFETLDSYNNQYQGWMIDDFSLAAETLPDCGAPDGNDTPSGATPLEFGGVAEGSLCPAGELDYFRFTGEAGDQVGAAITARSLGSPLDSTLTLLDSDGRSVLAENDDQVFLLRTDSFLTYRLSRSGVYYLKVRAWDHPASGGPEYAYSLRLYQDGVPPSQAAFSYPEDAGVLPAITETLAVSASDLGTGISHVAFFWHGTDWQTAAWEPIGEDWEGGDGWSMPFNAAPYAPANGLAFYARVYDWAGNQATTAVWNLHTPVIYLPMVQKPVSPGG